MKPLTFALFLLLATSAHAHDVSGELDLSNMKEHACEAYRREIAQLSEARRGFVARLPGFVDDGSYKIARYSITAAKRAFELSLLLWQRMDELRCPR